MRGLFGDVVELLKDRANRDLISKEDCGAAGMHEAILWNTTSKVGYIIKLLHLAKEHELFALTPMELERIMVRAGARMWQRVKSESVIFSSPPPG